MTKRTFTDAELMRGSDGLLYFLTKGGSVRPLTTKELDPAVADGIDLGEVTQEVIDRMSPAPVVVADTAARKLLATYDTTPYMGMRVVQTDQVVSGLPTLLWMLMGTDVTDDDNWFGQVLSNAAGELVADLRLADFTGIVPPANALGHVGPRLSLGDGVTSNGNQMATLADARYVPDGMVFARSIKTSNISATVRHDGTGGATGVCYSVNGAAAVYAAVAADTDLVLSIPHAGGAPIDFYVWPASSITSGKLGNLVYLDLNNQKLTSFDHEGLGALEYLDLGNNLIPSFIGIGLGAATEIYLSSNSPLTILIGAGLDAVESLIIGLNNFDGLALDAIYTSLPETSVDATIYIFGNPGVGTDTPALATAKGWTVDDGS